MVGEFVAMALQEPVDGAVWELGDEFGGFVTRHSAVGLNGILVPLSVGIGDVAIVAKVCDDEDCVGACLPEFFAFVDDDILVVEEFIIGE